MADVIEINAETGEVTERSYTAEELAQREADAADALVREQQEMERIATLTAARDHALSLGFTEEQVAVMWPSLAQ